MLKNHIQIISQMDKPVYDKTLWVGISEPYFAQLVGAILYIKAVYPDADVYEKYKELYLPEGYIEPTLIIQDENGLAVAAGTPARAGCCGGGAVK